MRQRVISIIGSLLALGLIILPMLGCTAAAQSGLERGNAYQSPQFGYTLTWGDVWSVRARDVISNRGGYDTITLRGPLGTLLVQGQGSGITPADAVTKRAQIEGRDDQILEQDLDAAVPTARMLVGRKMILIEGHTLETNNAVVLIVLSAREKDFDAALASVHEQVQFNGGALLTGADIIEGDGTAEPTAEATAEPTNEPSPEPTETPAAQTVAGPTATPVDITGESGIFDSTDYGFTFDYSPAVWTTVEDFGSGDVDGLKLISDTGILVIMGWDIYGADPVACLDGEAAFYAEDDPAVSNWAPAEDAAGAPIRYEAADYAYGVFTLTYTDPDDPRPAEIVDYLECRAIPGEDAVVIILGSAEPDLYNEHLDAVLDVAETILFTNEAPSTITPPATEPASGDLPDTALTGSLYTSPSFGFTIDLPVQWEVIDEVLAVNDEQLTLSNGTSEILVWATDAAPATLAACVDFAAENAPYALELAETADGRPFRGDDRNGAYGNFLYDDGARAYSISCRAIVEGESVIIVAHDVPADELASQRKFRIDLQQSIELP